MENRPSTYLKVVFPNGRSEIYRLEEQIDFNPVGYRVLVPLKGSGKGATAIVVKRFLGRLDESVPLVDSFPDRHPVVNPVAIELLKGVLIEYLTTLGESLFKLLPSWADWYQETFVVPLDKNPVGVPKSVLKVFEKLRKRGKVEYEKLKREIDWKVLHLLEEHHLIEIKTLWVAPKVEEDYYHLVVEDRDEIERLIRRVSKQRRAEIYKVLEIFNERGSPLTREDLIGISSQTIAYLLKKGILTKERSLLKPFRNKPLKEIPLREYPSKEPPDKLLLKNLSPEERFEKIVPFAEWFLQNGKDFLVLVPEYSLLEFYAERFYRIFGDRTVVYSETLPQRERIKNWFLAAEDFPKIFITTPQRLFAPLKNLGGIYVDDEGAPAYKMERSPYFNLKRLAFALAKLLKGKLIVSSNPPSVEQFLISKTFEVEERKIKTQTVLLNERIPFGDGILTELLRKGERVLVLVPKRGYSYLKCPRCGKVLECPRCESFLTLQREGYAECSLCGYRTEELLCPSCGEETKPFGYGIERVKEILKDIAPPQTEFSTTPPHFGRFDTVALLFADTILSVPDYRKGEEFFNYLWRAKNLLTEDGTFILHTLQGEHHAVKALLEGDENTFYLTEVEYRKLLELPPFARLYLVAIKLSEENEAFAKNLYRELKTLLPHGVEVSFSKSPTFRLRETYRYQVLVKLPLRVEFNILKKTAKVLREFKNRYRFVRVIPNPRSTSRL